MNYFKLATLNLAGIDSMEDIIAFLDFLIKDQKLFYHPMDNFIQYKKYSEEQRELLSCLAEGCHRECEYRGTDFFTVTREYYQHLINKIHDPAEEQKEQLSKPHVLIVIEGGNISSIHTSGGVVSIEVFDNDLAKDGDARDIEKTVQWYPCPSIDKDEYDAKVEKLNSLYSKQSD